MRLILFPLITLFLNLPTLAAAEMIKATASFSILGDIVERVGGDLVDVSSIVGADSDKLYATASVTCLVVDAV